MEIIVEHLSKIYGASPQIALDRLAAGDSKADILKESGNIVGLYDASFSISKGEVFIAMGLSGSGKSTLVRCINRLITPTSGNVYIDNENILAVDEKRLRELRRTKISMVFQHFGLFPHMTVAENVEYGLKVCKVDRKERTMRALETLDLVGLRDWAHHRPTNLSGGMQQRVGLARALATNPDILLMDEPFSALDPLIRREMQRELIELQGTVRKTILFITHDLDEALRLGDRIAVMKDGEINQIGTPEEIVSHPATDYVAEFTHDIDRGRVYSVISAMTKNQFLIRGKDTVQLALAYMEKSGSDALFVVDDGQKPVGYVLYREIIMATRKGDNELEQVMRDDFPKVHTSASLADTYCLCTGSIPIAVVDEHGCYQGILFSENILAKIADDDKRPDL